MSLDSTSFERVTRAYWNSPNIQDYICTPRKQLCELSLLQAEIQYARENNQLRVDNKEEWDTLVLLVGFSLEPLLQSISAYKPGHVLLVLNETYGDQVGNDFGNSLLDLMPSLKEVKLINQIPNVRSPAAGKSGFITKDNPAAVFQTLLQALHGLDPAKVIIDITGGKKSMVTGAFLYAAFADVAISYVDFEKYDPDRGRPYGYTCKIGRLSNPFQTFVLREWQNVRRFYQGFQFRAAIEQLREIKTQMTRPLEMGGEQLFSPHQVDAVNNLESILECYERWDNGDFYGAKNKGISIKAKMSEFRLPSAADVLGDAWPHSENGDSRNMAEALLEQYGKLEKGSESFKGSSFYVHEEAILTYACDELERVKRLIKPKEDYRSALLRAAALNETLIKARFLILFHGRHLRAEALAAAAAEGGIEPQVLDPESDVGRAIHDQLHKYLDLPAIIRAMRWRGDLNEKKKKDYRWQSKAIGIPPIAYALRRNDTDGVPFFKKFWKNSDLGLNEGQLSELRHKAIHTAFAIPEGLATAAHRWVARNLEDFECNWLMNTTTETISSLTWSEVCRLCKLDALLPANLITDSPIHSA